MCFSLNVILVTAATYQDEELRQHPSNTQQQQHLRLKGKNEKKRDLLKYSNKGKRHVYGMEIYKFCAHNRVFLEGLPAILRTESRCCLRLQLTDKQIRKYEKD